MEKRAFVSNSGFWNNLLNHSNYYTHQLFINL